jgi:hypothetical protein
MNESDIIRINICDLFITPHKIRENNEQIDTMYSNRVRFPDAFFAIWRNSWSWYSFTAGTNLFLQNYTAQG